MVGEFELTNGQILDSFCSKQVQSNQIDRIVEKRNMIAAKIVHGKDDTIYVDASSS
jgi:hypothetical protein